MSQPHLEPDKPKNFLITLYLTVSAFFTFGVVLVTFIYFRLETQSEHYEKIDLAPTADLMTLRHRETELLGQDINGLPKNTYAKIPETKDLYRIPIDRAMELETQAPWHASATPAVGAQTPSTTHHAAPSKSTPR